MRTLLFTKQLLGFLLGLALLGGTAQSADLSDNTQFVTRSGLGPDKWVSLWLIERFVTPNTPVLFVSSFENLSPNNLAFDEPGARYYRTTDHTNFSQLVREFTRDDRILNGALLTIIHDIEVNTWQEDSHPASEVVEKSFRALQERYQRDQVPKACYLAFFDYVYKFFDMNGVKVESFEKEIFSQFLQQFACHVPSVASLQSKRFIPEVSASYVFDLIRSGKRVAFVDVREVQEFAEQHIPTAINYLIRDADEAMAESLSGYDVVVSYCVKDFRGFEMAKKLKLLGVKQSVIMNPYGLKGWIKKGLPVVKPEDNLLPSEEQKKLTPCLARRPSCEAIL